MKEVTIDFSSCSNWWDVHELLKEKLGFPEFYGRNLDALWDLLTGYMELPVIINIGLSNMKKNALDEVGDVLRIIKQAEKQYGLIHINLL